MRDTRRGAAAEILGKGIYIYPVFQRDTEFLSQPAAAADGV